MVRPSGFAFYPDFRDVNDDAYMSDPRVIAVGAVRADGRVASYSSRGAAVLLSAVSGDAGDGYPNLFTTDRTGNSAGFNIITFPSDPMLSDYVWGNLRFSATQDSASQIAGLCALLLSANSNLTYRDVQQILIHSSRHIDKGDPQIRRNGAGYLVSHKSGYGIPDAAEAVRLADHWQNRAALVRRTVQSDMAAAIDIPDASLRVYLTDLSTQPTLNRSFSAFPSIGLHTDDPTAELPIVDAGTAPEALTIDLHGKAALIEDPTPTFPLLRQLDRVAAAGAEFAIVFNTTNSPSVLYDWLVKRLDFAPIPVVLVPTEAGPIIKDYITNRANLRVQLRITPAVARFAVDDALLVEHVGVRVRTSHPSRQDLRITLVSPQGTRSIMQTINSDQNPGPVDWTYWSVQHFYERSSGLWSLEVTDEVQDITGQLLGAELYLEGTPIVDLDDDGLDDVWEISNFTSFAQDALDDPDHDGSWNAREQILATNPNLDQTTFKLVTSLVNSNTVRAAFPSIEGTNYVIRASTNLNSGFQDVATIPGSFGETEITTDKVEPHRFFQIRKLP
jgi:subtilisin-like proprotein convertase family protein